MARPRKRRIRWERPANAAAMRYRLYWAIGESVGYDSDYREFNDATELILPDDLPGLSINAHPIRLGVSAINEAGNESDIAILDVQLDFAVPEAPKNLQVLDIDLIPDSRNLQKLAMACVGIVILIGLGVLALATLGDRVLDYFPHQGKNDYAMITGEDSKAREGKNPRSEIPVLAAATERSAEDNPIRSGIDKPSFKVEAIIWSVDETNSFAVIDGNEVRVGDFIEGATVTGIGRDYVALEAGDSRFRVTMR
jgi:hypothetical protein